MNEFWIFDNMVVSGGVQEGGYSLKFYREEPADWYSKLKVKGETYYIQKRYFTKSIGLKGFLLAPFKVFNFFRDELVGADNNHCANAMNKAEVFHLYEVLTRTRIVTYDDQLTFGENVPLKIKTHKPTGLMFEGKTYLFIEANYLKNDSNFPEGIDYHYFKNENDSGEGDKAALSIAGIDLEDAVQKCHNLKLQLFRNRVRIANPATTSSMFKTFYKFLPGA